MVAICANTREGVALEPTDVRFGSKADSCSAATHVRFTPNSDRKSRHPQTVMSALPPKADMCGALGHVCYGPIADMNPNIQKDRPAAAPGLLISTCLHTFRGDVAIQPA